MIKKLLSIINEINDLNGKKSNTRAEARYEVDG